MRSRLEAFADRWTTDTYAGLIRLHVLHHAVKERSYGLVRIEELGLLGYKLSAWTLYPILHGLKEKGVSASIEERTGSAACRVYRATSAGDTVNTAKRVASGNLPGRVHVSADTRKALGDALHFEARGLLEVKGKGLMGTYFLYRQ
jgi:DNA-binding PadR family transcriptional regulator